MTRKFVKDEVIPVAAELDRTGTYPWEILRKAHKLGLLNANIPTEYGKWNNILYYTY